MDKAFSSGRQPVQSNALLYRIAIHEAGHAVARIRLGIGTIDRITIEFDRERGGRVSWIPDDDDEATEGRLTAELVATLAGRAAEEVIVGSVSAYSGGPEFSDLAQANDLAFRMEATLGFGRTMAAPLYADHRQNPAAGIRPGTGRANPCPPGRHL